MIRLPSSEALTVWPNCEFCEEYHRNELSFPHPVMVNWCSWSQWGHDLLALVVLSRALHSKVIIFLFLTLVTSSAFPLLLLWWLESSQRSHCSHIFCWKIINYGAYWDHWCLHIFLLEVSLCPFLIFIWGAVLAHPYVPGSTHLFVGPGIPDNRATWTAVEF